MYLKSSFIMAAAMAMFSSSVNAVDTTQNPDLVAKLKAAATQLDRLKLLPNNDDWIHDFTQDQHWNVDKPGSVSNSIL
jgi:hypothetical protein